jgi:hypothetical protein
MTVSYRPAMAPKQINFEFISARFPADTLGRIDAVLREGEAKAEFIRAAVLKELNAREAIRRRHQRLIASALGSPGQAPSPSSK